MNTKLKEQDWSQFDNVIEELADQQGSIDLLQVAMKKEVKGANVMSDKQHRMIIALCTNELDMSAMDSFKFILKICPYIRERLSKTVLKETDLSGLYQVIRKNEAAKIIFILKTMSKRRKK